MLVEISVFALFLGFTLILAFLLTKLLLSKGQTQTKNLPKGSLGYPIIGETLGFIKAQKQNKGSEWLEERVSRYGPVFKTSLMGSPTVIFVGREGNKFVLNSPEDVLSAKKPHTMQKIFGSKNLAELTGTRYKLVKGAMIKFLKPECLQNYVKNMDELVNTTLQRELKDKETVETVLFMKKLSYDMACKILFDIKDGQTREALFEDFMMAFKAILSLPINFPGTPFWRGQRARERIVKRDSAATLTSLMIWKLARDSEVYNKVLEEQMNIIKQKEGEEEKRLTWADIQNMKYTWRVAQELMRMIPPLFGTFRKTLKDTTYQGYDIPKGWQEYWAAIGTHMNKYLRIQMSLIHVVLKIQQSQFLHMLTFHLEQGFISA